MKAYVQQLKDIYQKVYEYLQDEAKADNQKEFTGLTSKLRKQINQYGKSELILFLNLISHIAKHHCYSLQFQEKIEAILTHFETDIKNNLSNYDIFHPFRNNKRIILFLINKELIHVDQSIINYFNTKLDITSEYIEEYIPGDIDYDDTMTYNIFYTGYRCFFNKEINEFNKTRKISEEKAVSNNFEANKENGAKEANQDDEEKEPKIEDALTPEVLQNYEEKRKKGENESQICHLIREDNLDEFIQYITQHSVGIKAKVYRTFYETHSFLLKRGEGVSLIEYAAFFGSIRILKYLELNGAEIYCSLMLYAIHSNNPELLNYIENKCKMQKNDYVDCLKESIKCHHNEMVDYFYNILLGNQQGSDVNETNINDIIHSCSLRYCNFYFLPDDLNIIKDHFIYACKFDYLTLVKFWMNDEDIDVNMKIILILIFFLIIFQKKKLIFYKISLKNFFLMKFKIKSYVYWISNYLIF